MVFQDSDAYKWLEAAAYAIADKPDKELEQKADELIGIIADAQDKDGYLNTYFTVKDTESAGQICLRAMSCTVRGTLSKPPVPTMKQRASESFLILP